MVSSLSFPFLDMIVDEEVIQENHHDLSFKEPVCRMGIEAVNTNAPYAGGNPIKLQQSCAIINKKKPK